MSATLAGEHRYLQIARTLRKEIVDGVYPVGSRLPTEHQLCERFAVSRYTVREALRRLREDNLVTSRPRAGTRVVAGPTSRSYAQDVLSIDDLLAFAAGAQLTIESNEMVTLDDEVAARRRDRLGDSGGDDRRQRRGAGRAALLAVGDRHGDQEGHDRGEHEDGEDVALAHGETAHAHDALAVVDPGR